MGFFFEDSIQKSVLLKGCGSCPIEKTCPKFKRSENNNADILVILENPTMTENGTLRPFSNLGFNEFRKILPQKIYERMSFTYAIRGYVQEDKDNKIILESCSSFLDKDIEELKPKIVLGVGSSSLFWAEKEFSSANKLSGCFFPKKVGTHSFLYYPIFDIPKSFGRNKYPSKYDIAFTNELKEFFEVSSSRFFPEIEPVSYYKNVSILKSTDDIDKEISNVFEIADKSGSLVGFDIETDGTAPYASTYGIITASFGCREKTISFSVNHPSDPNVKILESIKYHLSKNPWVHHSPYELFWLSFLFGEEYVYRIVTDNFIADTLPYARIVHSRSGILDLGTQTRLHLGFNVKSLSEVDPSKDWKSYSLWEWLEYNSLDSKYTSILFDHFYKYYPLTDRVWKEYLELCKLAVPCVLEQKRGLLVNKVETQRLYDDLVKKQKNVLKTAYGLEIVEKFRNKYDRPFKLTSNPDVVLIMQDFLDIKMLKPSKSDEEDKESADEEMLSSIPYEVSPLPSLILDYRQITKGLSTYIEPIINGKTMAVDGKIHPSYSITSVITGRRCVAKGTLIYDCSKGMETKIEDVCAGDIVYCYDNNMKPTFSRVLWAGKTGHMSVVRVHWSVKGKKHKGYVDVTRDHKIRLPNGEYKEACLLKKGDAIASIRLSKTKDLLTHEDSLKDHTVLRVEKLEGSVDVYDIEVDTYNNFIANEICVHNSSKAPNIQNFPSRLGKEIRNVICAEDGHVFIACDYGQLEARVLGMASLDKKLIEYQRQDYDIHTHWLNIILQVYPKYIDVLVKDYGSIPHDKLMKAGRTQTKTYFVFASLYGSTSDNCAIKMKIPTDVMKKVTTLFWEEFSGIVAYRKELQREYEKTGYVYNLLRTRRRGGVVGFNEMINYPIQSTASDIVRSATIRLSNYSFEHNAYYIHPRLEIHDDLTFSVPEDKIDEAEKIISDIMVEPVYDFITVPLTVETAVGKSWGSLNKKNVFKGNHHDSWKKVIEPKTSPFLLS